MRALFAAYRQSFSGLPPAMWGLAAVVFVNRAGFMVLPFLVLYLERELDFTPGAAGLLISCYGTGAILGALLGGWATDRFGARATMALSLVGSGLGFFTLLAFASFAAIAVVLVLLAAVTEAFRPANSSAVALCLPPEKRSRGYALQRLSINLGWAIGPVVGGFLAEWRYDALFVVDGATCLAAAILLVIVVPFDALRSSARDDRDDTEGSAGGKSATGSPEVRTASPWRDVVFLVAMVATGVVFMTFFVFFATFPLYLDEVCGVTERTIGAVLAINAVLIVAFEMVLVHRLEGRRKLRVVALGVLLQAGAFLALPLHPGLALAAGFVVVWTVGEMLIAPLITAWVSDRAPSASVGRYMSVFSLAGAAAHVVGPAAGLAIYGAGGPTTLWVVCGALLLGAVVCLLVLEGSAEVRGGSGAPSESRAY